MMRGRTARLAAAVLAGAVPALLGLAAAAQTAAAPELVPPYTRLQLRNGLVLLLLEHHELPIVHFELVLRAGSLADPPGKEGLADLTLACLRKGTQSLSAEELADELDFLGATLDVAASHERCTIAAQFLAKDVEPGLALLADLVLAPALPEDEVAKLIDLNVNGIRDLKDSPRLVVGRYFDSFLFQAHPFARPVDGTETSLPAITRADVQRFHDTYVRPNAAILAVAGDFDTETMHGQLQAAFGAWEARPAKLPAAAAPRAFKGRRVLLVDKPDATQAYFRIGNIGVERGHPDAAAIAVVNTIFGGRFTSWLNTELRIKSGLSYGASSTFVERRVPGAFFISSFTRTDDTGKALDLALAVLERLHAQGPEAAELESAQHYIRGQFPPSYETPGQLASAMAELEFFGLDRDFVNGFTRRTDAVTLADAKRVVSSRYPRRDLALVLVGQAAKVRKAAAKYGAVAERSIEQPGY